VPRHGAFPELIEDTQGGLLCEPLHATDLAAKLVLLLQDAEQARRLGLAGQQAIRDRYQARAMAQRTQALYQQLLSAV